MCVQFVPANLPILKPGGSSNETATTTTTVPAKNYGSSEELGIKGGFTDQCVGCESEMLRCQMLNTFPYRYVFIILNLANVSHRERHVSSRLLTQFRAFCFLNSSIGRLEYIGPDNKTRYCTGTLIDNSLVLTAAHCIYDPSLAANTTGGTGWLKVRRPFSDNSSRLSGRPFSHALGGFRNVVVEFVVEVEGLKVSRFWCVSGRCVQHGFRRHAGAREQHGAARAVQDHRVDGAR